MKEQDHHHHHQETAGSKSKAKMVVVQEGFFSDGDGDEILDEVDNDDDDEGDDNTFYIHNKPILGKRTDNSSSSNSNSNSISVRNNNNNDSELERDLQFAIMNSLLEINPTTSGNSTQPQTPPPPAENYDDTSVDGDEDDEFIKLNPIAKTSINPLGKRKWTSSPTPTPSSSINIIENGQNSNSNSNSMKDDDQSCFECEICIETKSASECFSVKGCKHAYCSICVGKYVVSRLRENITNIGCPVPDCQGFLEPDYCRPIIPPVMFEMWGFALCEAAIPEYEKFYCPHRDCSALMIDDGKKIVGQWECPHCKRMFCVQCKVPWHDSITCEEFQRNNVDDMGKEDGMLIELAETKRWTRCPSCNYYVEKVRGCMYVKCRCGTGFCYRCGNHIRRSMQRNCPHCSGAKVRPYMPNRDV